MGALNVRLTEETHKAFRIQAAREGRSLQVIVQEMVDGYLEGVGEPSAGVVSGEPIVPPQPPAFPPHTLCVTSMRWPQTPHKCVEAGAWEACPRITWQLEMWAGLDKGE